MSEVQDTLPFIETVTGAPNPDPMSPVEATLVQRVAALEEDIAVLTETLHTIEDAWLNFSLSASTAIEEYKRSANASDGADLDRRLKIIEASRV